MPTPAIRSGPRGVAWRFRRIMRWVSLASIVAAGLAVWLLTQGEPADEVRILILVALGGGLSVLAAAALIMLASIRSGKPRRPGPMDAEGEIQA